MSATSRNAPCSCGSGKKFKHCCGGDGAQAPSGGAINVQMGGEGDPAFDPSGYMAGRPFGPDKWASRFTGMPQGVAITRNAVPPGFLVVQGALAPQMCASIVAECEQQQGVRSTIGGDGAGSGASQGLATSVSDSRTSDFIDVRALTADIPALMRGMFSQYITPHFGKEIDWVELPEILRYGAGGKYEPHADADNWDAGANRWVRAKDRDISVLLYINDGFQGGEIDFPNFGMKLPPRQGMLIAFPSDRRYVHAARPVTSGIRYVIVAWAAVKGSERVGPGAPLGAMQV